LTLPKFPKNSNARKWLWIGIAAFAALQLYFVQEMIAALLIFSALFAVVAGVALILFLLDVASQRTLTWAEPQTKIAARYARSRGVSFLSSLERASQQAGIWAAPRAKQAAQYSRAKAAPFLSSLDRESQRTLAWAERQARHGAQYVRRCLTLIEQAVEKWTPSGKAHS